MTTPYDNEGNPIDPHEYGAVNDEGTPSDPYAIEPLALPSGGKVTFRSLAKLTGEDIRWIRGVDDKDGQMVFWNEMQRRAMVKLVDSWDLQTSTGRPLPLPREKNSPYAKDLMAFDLVAIERHLAEPLNRLFAVESGSAEGE
jgi:hypothetical protein